MYIFEAVQLINLRNLQNGLECFYSGGGPRLLEDCIKETTSNRVSKFRKAENNKKNKMFFL